METTKQFLFTADPKWLELAQEHQIEPTNDGWISRTQCLHLSELSGIKLPRWLMKDPSRRVPNVRGQYLCPELLEKA